MSLGAFEPKLNTKKTFCTCFCGARASAAKAIKRTFWIFIVSLFYRYYVITFLISCTTSIKLVIMSSLAWWALETPPESSAHGEPLAIARSTPESDSSDAKEHLNRYQRSKHWSNEIRWYILKCHKINLKRKPWVF